MAWRGVHISNPAKLNFADNQLVAKQDAGEVRLPLEDIAYIVIDAPHVSLTSTLISACMKSGIALIFSDETHTPCGVALPFHQHFRQGEIARLQVAMSEAFKARLWQVVVRRKVQNQASALAICGRAGIRGLNAAAERITPGDEENIEARAAREFFTRMFGRSFSRTEGSGLANAMLNYGYAIIRSAVARALTAFGLIPALGIKHASQTNAFNLADDMVEPFRPFVDIIVFNMLVQEEAGAGELTITHRRRLVSSLMETASFGREKTTLLIATERMAESLVQAIEGRSPAVLVLPELRPEGALSALPSGTDDELAMLEDQSETEGEGKNPP